MISQIRQEAHDVQNGMAPVVGKTDVSRRNFVTGATLLSSLATVGEIVKNRVSAEKRQRVDLVVKKTLNVSSVVTGIAWSSDAKHLAFASNFGTQVDVIALNDYSTERIQREGGGPFLGRSIDFLHNPGEILWACPENVKYDTALCVWDVKRNLVTTQIPGTEQHKDYAYNRAAVFSVSQSGTIAVSAANLGRNLNCYATDGWQLLCSADIEFGIQSTCISHDGNTVFCGSNDSKIYLIEVKSGSISSVVDIPSLPKTKQPISCIVIGGNDDSLFVGVGGRLYESVLDHSDGSTEGDSALFEVSIRNSKLLPPQSMSSAGVTAPIRQLYWPRASNKLFLADATNRLLMLDPTVKNSSSIQLNLEGRVSALGFSRDGSLLAIGTGRCLLLCEIEVKD